MSLKNALMGFKKQLEDKATDEKIQKMLQEQQDILKKCDDEITKTKELTIVKAKVDYSFKPEVLYQGGSCYYHTNIGGVKRKFRISVTSDTHDVVLKYHCRLSRGNRFSVNAKSYSEAQFVTDELFGKLYRVSGTVV